MTKGEEIRRLVKEVESQLEEGILPDGSCLFDPLKVRLATGTGAVRAGTKSSCKNKGKQLTVRKEPAIITISVSGFSSWNTIVFRL